MVIKNWGKSMRLNSTNIWDDVRDGQASLDDTDRRGRGRDVRTSVRAGSSGERKVSRLGVTGSTHANRHGISMKSLMKNRNGS